MEWIYSNGCLSASRPMPDGVCQFIYCIHPVNGGYTADAMNNAYGAERVAVRNRYCIKESVFSNLEKLMKDIENGNIYWLYTGFCGCVGEVTKEEY